MHSKFDASWLWRSSCRDGERLKGPPRGTGRGTAGRAACVAYRRSRFVTAVDTTMRRGTGRR